MFDDNAVDDGMEIFLNNWLQKNCKGDFKILKTKKKRIITGDIKISSKEELIKLGIDEVRGNIYFEKCSELVNLEGMFNNGARVSGTLAIIDCPKFNSLEGSPWDCKVLELTNLPQLKSLAGAPEWCNEVNIIRCGKRFKKEQVKSVVKSVGVVINCDVEGEEPNITEAFKDPILSKLQDAIVYYNKNNRDGYYHNDIQMTAIVNNDWKLSEITPSARKRYDVISDSEKDWCKDVQKIFRGKDDKEHGFVVGYNTQEGLVMAVMYHDTYSKSAFTFLKLRSTKDYGNKTSWGVNDIKSIFSKTRLVNNDIDTLYIYSSANFRTKDEQTGWNNPHDYEGRWQIQNNRRNSRRGMVDLSKDGLRELLNDNRNRYKAAAEKLRALRNSDKYKPLQEKVQKLMERTNKLTEKMWKDVAWCAKNRFRIEETMKSMFREYEYRSGRSNQINYSVDGGVMYAFRVLAIRVAELSTGDGYASESSVNSAKQELLKAIEKADKNLSNLGF